MTMTREELKQEIAKLNEEREAAMRQHEHTMYEITSKMKAGLAAVEAKKHAFMQQIANERVNLDTAMRHAACEEQVRYKAERMRIEDEKQQLFADYKAQANDNENE